MPRVQEAVVLCRFRLGRILRYDRGITEQHNSTVTFAGMGDRFL
jgi:hypothetical protein